MKRLLLVCLIVLFWCVPARAYDIWDYLNVYGAGTFTGDISAASGAFSGTGGVTFTDNAEWINSVDDGEITFQGVAGIVANQNLVFGLDGDTVSTGPSISSDSAEQITVEERVKILPDTMTDIDVDVVGGALNVIGLAVTQTLEPTGATDASGTARGLKVITTIAGSRFDTAANDPLLIGAEVGSNTLSATFGGLGNGGSEELDVIGLEAYAAESIFLTTGIFTSKDAIGARIQSIRGSTAGHSVFGDVITLKLLDSNADFGDGSITNTVLYIEYADANTTAALNDQILLEGAGGSGTGAGCSMNVELDGAACTGGTVLDVGATYQLCVVCD